MKTTNAPLLLLAPTLAIGLLQASCGSSGTNPVPPTLPGNSEPAAAAPSTNAETKTLAEVGLDAASLDRGASPCDDFYQFSCGGWLEKNEIPADRSRYGRFTEMSDRTEAELHAILETARKADDGSPAMQKIGAYYGACMDEAAIEKSGTSAIDPLLAKAAKIRNRGDVDALVRELHSYSIQPLFAIGSSPDFKDATTNILLVDQGGLALPDRDYYLSDDDKFVAIRAAYQKHVARMLELAGWAPKLAARGASDVLKIETELARASKSRVELRDPQGVYNRVDRKGLAALAPSFDWKAYFAALGEPEIAAISVDAPAFFQRFNTIRSDIKAPAWKAYLTFTILDQTSELLPRRFVDESFSFEKLLSGAEEQRERWKRCIDATDGALGELLARPYLEEHFSPESKRAAIDMVKGITQAFSKVLDETEWMSEETKEKGRIKLAKMATLVGYPDDLRRYDFEVTADNYAANALRAARFERARDLAKVGTPYDRSEWYMTPADGQRLLQPARQPDGLPGRHSPATFL